MTMPEINESVRIGRPLADVFAYATDPDNQTTIASNITEYETDGPIQKGTKARGVTRVAGKRVEWTAEFTEFDEPNHVEIRSVEAPMGFRIRWDYEDVDGDTQVSFHQEVDELGGFFGRLGDAVVTKMYSRDVKANLENLKTLLESE